MANLSYSSGDKSKLTSPHQDIVQLKVGEAAPQFCLPAHSGGQICLTDYKGQKNVLLAFYPKDDTPGCTSQMCAFSENLERFADKNTEILAVSCDSIDNHQEFAGKYNLQLTLLADQSGDTGRAYGAVRGDRILADRLLFLIDIQGIIRFMHRGMPDTETLLNAIDNL
ncbi:MAG: peroxiredoxin [Candidatus Obscuribacterales bacterium]|nr:peroxiredoxin [Candidatus Obscuribacterales bacterium]